MDPDDFFFVTDRKLFDHLKGKKFNVVLQDNERVTDDGSLSVYFARKGIPYVNVEAQNGHRREQLKMLKTVRTMLNEAALENNSCQHRYGQARERSSQAAIE